MKATFYKPALLFLVTLMLSLTQVTKAQISYTKDISSGKGIMTVDDYTESEMVEFFNSFVKDSAYKIEQLRISHHNKVKTIPKELKVFKNLQELAIDNTPITKMPEAIQYLTNLNMLILEKTNITTLDKGLTKLKKLDSIFLTNSPIEELPRWIKKMKQLRFLELSGTKITRVPKSFAKLKKFEKVILSDYQKQLGVQIKKMHPNVIIEYVK